MTLPQETIDRLVADKTEEMLNYDGSYPDSYIEGYQDGIKAGATEWAGRAEQEIKELRSDIQVRNEDIKQYNKEVKALQVKCDRYEKALKLAGLDNLNEALSGGGDRICPNCNMVFNADRHGCCRECGSDEYNQQNEI